MKLIRYYRNLLKQSHTRKWLAILIIMWGTWENPELHAILINLLHRSVEIIFQLLEKIINDNNFIASIVGVVVTGIGLWRMHKQKDDNAK